MTRTPLKFTEHGPVIFEDPDGAYCIILRSAFLAAGGAPYFAQTNYHRAQSITDFEDRLGTAVAPTMNYVAADIAFRSSDRNVLGLRQHPTIDDMRKS